MPEVNANYLVITLICINLVWYLIKLICIIKGYKVSFIYHIKDLTNFTEIIKSENTVGLKIIYVAIFVCLFTSIVAIFLVL